MKFRPAARRVSHPRAREGHVAALGFGLRTLLTLSLAVSASGCASTTKWRLPTFGVAKDTDETAAEESAVAASDTGDTAPIEDAPAFRPDPTKAGGALAAASESATGHSGETLKMIHDELAASDPLEREQLLSDWKKLDDETLRDVIRIRRMVRSYRDPSPAVVAATDVDPADDSTVALTTYGAPEADRTETSPFARNADGSTGTPSAWPAAGTEVAAADRASWPSAFADDMSAKAADAAGFSATQVITQPLKTGREFFGQLTGTDVGADAEEPFYEVPRSWEGQLESLVARAETRVADAKADLDRVRSGVVTVSANDGPVADQDALADAYERAQAELRLLYVLSGNQSRAVRAIPDLPPAEQEFWQQTAWGLLTYFDAETLPDKADRATQAVNQFRQAAAKLQPRARLELRSLAFSPKINSFGSFERFGRDEFAPGQRVLLYVEIANFASVLDPTDGTYRTKLRSRLEIFRGGDEEGSPVHEIEFPETVDVCSNARHDYFHSYDMKVPTQLAAGPYRLTLTVTDSQTAKAASERVNFVVR